MSNTPHASTLAVIGRAERVDLVDFGMSGVSAKVDTGADTSSLWASDITYDEAVGRLTFSLFGPGSEFFTGTLLSFERGQFDVVRVASSTGHRQVRYSVKLRIRLGGRLIKATFTLADRSQRTYPILLGRRLLHKKFLVDVSKGEPLSDLENTKRRDMRLALNDMLN